MSENKGTEATEATEATEEPQEEVSQPKETRRRSRKQPRLVKVRGRISTTELAAGDVAEVERTPVLDKLLKSGFVEEVKE